MSRELCRTARRSARASTTAITATPTSRRICPPSRGIKSAPALVWLFGAQAPARTLLLVIAETLIIFSAMVAAVFLRFGADAELTLSYQQGFLKVTVVAAVCVICLYYFDLYDSLVISNPREVVTRLIVVLGVVCLVVAVLYYLYPPLQLGRGIFLLGIILIGLALVGSRELFFALNRSALFADSTILLGDGPLPPSLHREIQNRCELGMRLLWYIRTSNNAEPQLNGLPVVGKLDNLLAFVEQNQIKRIVVALPDRRSSLPLRELLDLRLKRSPLADDATLLA